MEKPETIEVKRNDKTGAWDAKFSDPETVKLFGVDMLPTSYLLPMPKDKVVAKIQALNPTCRVF